MGTTVIVNSLPLPNLLVALIDSGRWGVPRDERALDRVFSEHAGATFYSIEQMKRETEWLHSYACEGSYMRGRVAHDRPPGDIDPSKAILIGDAGIGFDSPLALDYRSSSRDPSVLAFQWNEKRWLRVADSFSEFVEKLGL